MSMPRVERLWFSAVFGGMTFAQLAETRFRDAPADD